MYSATQADNFEYLKRQIIWFAVSLVFMIVMALVDYEVWIKLSPIFYGISLILLIAVLFTKSINGASSWFNIGVFSLQPAEIAKISVILFTTATMAKIHEREKDGYPRPIQ